MKTKSQIVFNAFIVLIASLAYLPLVSKFGYTFDDWYLMWSAKAYGPQAFFSIFSIDRPLRAYLMFPTYLLFGENPLWYSLSAFILRLAGAFCFWWILRMLWPEARNATAGMALLFVVYPGFLSQPNAIDYQSHIAALALALFSLALTVKAVQMPGSRLKRSRVLLISAILGWLYLGLMEYYIGFELIRALLVGLLALRSEKTWPTRIKKAILNWLPLAIVPFGFVYWRVFVFAGERKATDVNEQLALAMVSPLRALLNWAISLLHDLFQTMVMAWVTPLAQLWGRMTGFQIAAGLALGVLSAGLAWFVMGLSDSEEETHWRAEAFWLGAAMVVAGLIPVVLANREVAFPYYSRYTLISSTGVAVLLAALIFWLPGRVWQRAVFSILVLVSVLTHFANSAQFARETSALRDFWWQVSWRIPQLEKNTTLVALGAVGIQQEDYFVWGPANLIYYPEPTNPEHIQPGVYAAILTPENIQRILKQERQVYDNRRTIRTYANFRNILILNLPQPDACVRALDNQQLEFSIADGDSLHQIAPFSEIEHILVDEKPHTPPNLVFGPEPAHGWCYYYQKASLARQKNDWSEVLRLGAEVESKDLTPGDPIEWIPFLQAEALIGSPEKFSEMMSWIEGDAEREEICRNMIRLNGLSDSARSQIQTTFCTKK